MTEIENAIILTMGVIIHMTLAATPNIILLIIVVWQLKKYKREIKYKLRPWIGRYDRQECKMELVQVPDTSNNTAQIHFNNYGSQPALHLRIKSYVTTDESKADLDTAAPEDPIVILPNEVIPHRILLTEKQYECAKKNTLYFGYKIEYTDINKIKASYEITGVWDKGIARITKTSMS